MQEKSIKVLFLALFLMSIFSIFVIAKVDTLDNATIQINNNTNDSISNQIDKPSAEKCFDIEDRRARIKCKLQNKEEIKSMIAERYFEYANSSSIYETCQGLKNQGLCVAFMARSLKCYNLESEKKDRCFKVVSDFKDTKISSEIQAEGNITIAREKIVNYMILVLQNLESKAEKAHIDGKISDDDASIILEKITRIKRLLLEGNTKKNLIKSEITELKAFWQRSIKDG